MQLTAFADLTSATWDLSIDGRWLGEGPGEKPTVELGEWDATSAGSARFVVVWLNSGDTYTFSAVRPSNAKGQDKDAISVGLPESDAPMQVFDPRLSTEYDAAGTPQRFGIELWLGADEDADQHPRRLAGEAQSPTPALVDGPVRIHPMDTRGNGVDGLGLYVLVAR